MISFKKIVLWRNARPRPSQNRGLVTDQLPGRLPMMHNPLWLLFPLRGPKVSMPKLLSSESGPIVSVSMPRLDLLSGQYGENYYFYHGSFICQYGRGTTRSRPGSCQ